MYYMTLNLIKSGDKPPSQGVSEKIPQCCAFSQIGWLVPLYPTITTLHCEAMASSHLCFHHQTEFLKPGTWSILFTQYNQCGLVPAR